MSEHDDPILEALGNNVYRVRCAFCGGRGLKPYKMKGWEIETYHNQEVCPICDGKGVLKLQADDLLIPDARCQGTGHEPYNAQQVYHDRACETCQGLGVRSLTGDVRVLR
ncbi:MAG: hypothetical protein JXB35_16900 [Anaerolineae bacterium]|nr:hypothetical protein [Anaerolineae bacterium]